MAPAEGRMRSGVKDRGILGAVVLSFVGLFQSCKFCALQLVIIQGTRLCLVKL